MGGASRMNEGRWRGIMLSYLMPKSLSPLVGLAPINLSKLAPDILAMIVRIAHALNKASPGGAKITKKEWAEIGEAAGVVALDIVSDVAGKGP